MQGPFAKRSYGEWDVVTPTFNQAKGYDYSQPGAYFGPICVQGDEFLFGGAADGRMELNSAGIVAQEC